MTDLSVINKEKLRQAYNREVAVLNSLQSSIKVSGGTTRGIGLAIRIAAAQAKVETLDAIWECVE